MTERPRPAVSVVIPTHNRRDLLSRVLDALAPQLDAEVEVVVVADGCSDGTVEMLKARTDFAPRLVERPGLGPSVARNAGAAAAQGALLVFIDDDVIPGKGWLAAHRAAAAANPGSVVLGPYPPARVASRDLFRLDMRAWWDTHFARLAEPGHRITYTDVLTGNLSLPSDLWRRLGGLDERIWHPEDYELGLRLIGAGHPVVIAPDAEAVHHEHETMTLAGSFRRCRHEARGDVIIAEKHPEIARRLKPVKWRRWGSRLAGIRDRVIFACGAGLDGAARWVERRLPWIGRHGLRKTHETVKRYLQSYWYVRGLRDHFSRFADWQAFALQPWPEPEGPATTIDLADGLKAAEARLDALRPAAVDLFLGERYVGHLPRQAGAEPWAGRHLRGEIYRHHGPAYLRAIAGARADPTPTADPGRLDEALARMSGWFGTSDPPWVFYEQSAQWGRGPAAERDSTPPAGPALSFIVPAWNAAATVDETLASLQAQTRTDWEAIVVDDGSTDDTLARLRAAAARDWRIRVLPIARSGAGAARNAGLARARADWIAFLDADDWLDPTFAEKMLLLAQSAGTEAVYCGFRKVTSDGAFQLDFFDADFETDVFGTLASRCAITIHSVVVRRQAVLEAGAFLPPNLPCEDWDLWLRLARRGAKFKGLAETLAFYRLGQASVTTDYRHLANGGFRVLELAHGPDARVADPAPGCAEGAPPENLPWLKMFYALWCAGADIGAGGTGDGFLDALPRPLPVFGHEQALARSFAEALVTGARLPPAQMVGRLASWDAAIGRRLDELAEGQPRDGVALDLRRGLERWALRALPAGDEAVLSLMARIAIRGGPLRSIDLPDEVDSVLVDVLGTGNAAQPVEVPAFGRLDSGDQVSLAGSRMPPEQLDRYFAKARRSGLPSRTAEHLSAAEAAAAETIPDLGPAPTAEAFRDLQANPDKTADYWNEVFAEADPWSYTSAYEQRKYERTLELLPDGPIGRALELACAEGHFTRQLAPRVERLAARDIASRAVERARGRCEGLANVDFGTLDVRRDPIPGGQDLITCSEFLYYLDGREELAAVAARIAAAVNPGGAIVMANHFLLRDDKGQTGFDWDQPYGAKVIHEVFAATPGLALEASIVTELYRVDRFRRLAPGATPPEPVIREEPMGTPLTPHAARFAVWGGAVARRREVEGETTWTVPVLMYHSIAASGPEALSRWRLAPDLFREQLRLLRRHGFRSTTIDEILTHRASGMPLSGRPVLLSFDDGFRDFAETAWEILQENDFGAEVFLPTDQVGGSNVWDGGGTPLMDWPTIRRLSGEGVRFGSHLASHRPAPALSGDELLAEAVRSRRAIAAATGIAPRAVAAPYGTADSRLAGYLALAGYEMCLTTEWRQADLRADPMRIPRMEVWGTCTAADLARILGL